MKKTVFIFFILLLSVSGKGQNITQDTVFIALRKDTLRNNNFSILHAKDLREEKELFVFGKRKYLLLPVDIYVFPEKPLEMFLTDLYPGGKTFNAEILNFYISERKGNFSSVYVLDAKIAIYEDSVFLGQLLYQTEYKKTSWSEKPPESCLNSIKKWENEFDYDMNILSVAGEKSSFILPNLFTEKEVRDQYLNLNMSLAIGKDWWLADAELFFTPPEIKKRTVYVANIIRYLNHPEFESFAYGWKSEHLQYRITDLLTLDASANILLGINRWKNIEIAGSHGLEQLINLNVSFSQSVGFKTRKSHLYGKAGILENMFYIYDFGFKFKPGIYLTIGGKI